MFESVIKWIRNKKEVEFYNHLTARVMSRLSSPQYVDTFPVRQDITVLGPDLPRIGIANSEPTFPFEVMERIESRRLRSRS